jgi:hypothetical protein
MPTAVGGILATCCRKPPLIGAITIKWTQRTGLVGALIKTVSTIM